MLAIVLDEGLRLTPDHPRPVQAHGEALIEVRLAGICATDLEMVGGYKGFRGVLGHEFVGTVIACDDGEWIGRRVVGEINIGCGECYFCRQGIRSHCLSRRAIGINGRDGAFAEYVALPVINLHAVPDGVPDDAAVFAEPLAAALQVLDQVEIGPEDRVGVVGDGRLGLLVGQVLATTGAPVSVVGRHPEKLALAAGWGLQTGSPEQKLDLVVDCTGSPAGLNAALELVRPRGTLVLKSTYRGPAAVDMTRVVVDEIRLIGSRCGPFAPALELLRSGRIDVASLIMAVYPLADGLRALERATRPGVLKVLLQP